MITGIEWVPVTKILFTINSNFLIKLPVLFVTRILNLIQKYHPNLFSFSSCSSSFVRMDKWFYDIWCCFTLLL